MPARALIIGLDSTDPGLLQTWIGDGHLPHLKALQDRGVAGPVITPLGLADHAVWTSFFTGTGVGSHGRYNFRQLAPDARRYVHMQGKPSAETCFWTQLSKKGMRVAALDLPKSALAQPFNGIQLCDWLVHGREYQPAVSTPSELAADVIARFGAPPESLCAEIIPPLSNDDIKAMATRLLTSADMKLRCGLHYLKSEAWDVFAIGFKEAHCGTHAFWNLLDSRSPGYGPERNEACGEPLRAVYQALDRAVGELIAEAGSMASVLVFSTLGMDANFSGNHLMPAIAWAINEKLGTPAIRLHNRLGPPLYRPGLRRFSGWNTRRTLCRFLFHNESSGTLRLNVRGRDPGGPIESGAEYDRLCAQLMADLKGLKDPDTGRALVQDVVHSKSAYPGPANDALPDLFIVWDRTAPIRSACSPMLGTLTAEPYRNVRPGNHRAGGHFFVTGAAARQFPASIDIAALSPRFLSDALGSPARDNIPANVM